MLKACIKKISILLVICLAALIIYFSIIETPYRPISISTTTSQYSIPNLIAHKAKHSDFPSNSIEGINALYDLGIKGFEIDIQSTKDGIPVLFHGLDLSDGSDGSGKINKLNFEDLKKITLTYNKQNSLIKISRLEEILKNYCGKALIILDIKSFNFWEKVTTKATVDLIKKFNCQTSVIIDSLNPIILLTVRKLDRTIPVSFSILEETKASKEESQVQLNQIPFFLKWRPVQNFFRALILPDYLSPRLSLDPERIKKLKALGYPLIAWTVDDLSILNNLKNLGVNSFLSNTAQSLQEHLSSINVDDASRLNSAKIRKIYLVNNRQEIQAALNYANKNNLKISIAGKRHSMGGQTIAPDGLVIDMNSMNKVKYDLENKLLTAEAGASWKEIQEVLDRHQRSVEVMQSDNIFSLGGSMSVNVHGWQANRPPLSSTVQRFELILANSKIIECTRPFNAICRAALGGYGLFGVITEATIKTTENVALSHQAQYFPSNELLSHIKKSLADPKLELLYARLRVDQANFLNEVGLHSYFRINQYTEPLPEVQIEELVKTKRAIFRLSERSDSGKLARWIAERDLSQSVESSLQKSILTRNQVMYSDFQFIWPSDFSKHDILHEYFIPIQKAEKFIEQLKIIIPQYKQDLLNITIRHLLADTETLLAYTKEESLSFVLLFSQAQGTEAEDLMKSCTQELIQASLNLNGTFYLPYRRHFKPEQLQSSYPQLKNFIELKNINDRKNIFSNQLWDSFQTE